MRYFQIFIVILALAVVAVVEPANGQTIPAPVWLPLVQRDGAPDATPTPTATSTLVPPTATPTMTPSPTPTITPTPGPTGAVVIDNSVALELQSVQSLYVFGSVTNNTTGNVQSVQLDGILRDTEGSIVDGATGYYAFLDTMASGMSSPFLVMFLNPPENWSSYELTVTWSGSDRAPVQLELTNVDTYFDQSNAFHVRGTVRNQTDKATDGYVKIIGTMFDADGNVTGASARNTNPPELAPGQQTTFDLEIYFWAGKPDRSKVASYAVAAYDD